MSEPRKKLKLKKSVKLGALAILVLILVLYCALTIPGVLKTNKLKKLGYSPEAIEVIKDYKWTDMIIDGQLYSDNLNNNLPKETFQKEFIDLYLVTDSLSSDDFKLYGKLILKGYEKVDVLAFFKDLEFFEMTPLLVFDIVNVNEYINDVINHRVSNSRDNFVLSNDYLVQYANVQSVINQGSVSMLVNKHYALSSDFEPATLIDVPIRYASKGLILASEASDALASMVLAAEKEGYRMYAASGYRDYAYQDELYEQYAKKGIDYADSFCARPGHSEHQTGLTVDMAAISTGGLQSFAESAEYQWMLQNAHLYGWILRYPTGKEQITGYDAEPWHWRYVGIDLATKVYNSKLTYDEYYTMYLMD